MRCVVIGESLVDLIGQPGSWDFTAKPGGSPLNVAVALSRLDAQVEFITETGDDLFGEIVNNIALLKGFEDSRSPSTLPCSTERISHQGLRACNHLGTSHRVELLCRRR